MYEAQVQAYQADGYVKIDQFFSKDEVKILSEAAHHFLTVKAPTYDGRDVNFVEGKVNSFHALHREEDSVFMEWANHEKLHNLVQPFLDDSPELRAMELFAKPAQVGMPSPIHQDNYYWCVAGDNALTVWVALNDCDESNGGIVYYQGSHKLGMVPHKDSFAPGSSQMVADASILEAYERVCPSLKAGDCLLHHSLTVHESGPNTSDRSRRGWTLQYKAASAGYDSTRKQEYEARLKAQIASRQS